MNDSALSTGPNSALGLGPGYMIAERYQVVKLLGSGGFAAVFQAFDNQIERQVAIKVLNIAAVTSPGTEMEPFLERFRREARLAARIHHPNVVEIHDFGVLPNQHMPYIIMEMLQGHDLNDEIKSRGGMEPARALPLFCGALEALGEAHRLGIVHKDIKPANLFLSRPGTRNELLKVVDFGIAHIGGTDEARMTQTGAMFGTPQYLSPEYVQTQTVGPQMDVYQMGLVLVELLTGRSVVEDESPWQCALKHATGELVIPSVLLDGELGPVITKALEFDPAERYPDAIAFVDALHGVDVDRVGDARGAGLERRPVETVSGPLRNGATGGQSGGAPASGAAAAAAGGAAASAKVSADAADAAGSEVSQRPAPTERVGMDASETGINGAKPRKKSLKGLLAILFVLLALIVGCIVVVMNFWLDFPAGARLWDRITAEVSAVVAPAETPANAKSTKKAAKKKATTKKKAAAKKKSSKSKTGKKSAPAKKTGKKPASKKKTAAQK